MSLGQDGEWLLRHLSLRHHHVERRHRKVEQRRVLDFLSERQGSTEQHSAPGRDGDDIAGSQHGLRRGVDELCASPDAFHEDALGLRGALEIRDRPAGRGIGQPIGADAPFLVGQVNMVRGSASRRHLRRQFPALRLQVDSQQPGAPADRNQTTNPVPTR